MNYKSQICREQIMRSVLLFFLVACISVVVLVFISCSISYTQTHSQCSTLWFMLKNNDLSDKSLIPHMDLQYERCRRQILEHDQ